MEKECRRCSLSCLLWWMMLLYEMVCKDAASFGLTAETVQKRQHVQFPSWIPTLFSPALFPWAREWLRTPQTKVHKQKRNTEAQKALYVMLSTIDLFHIFDRQHKNCCFMACQAGLQRLHWHSHDQSILRYKCFLDKETLAVSNSYVFVASTQLHIQTLLRKSTTNLSLTCTMSIFVDS